MGKMSKFIDQYIQTHITNFDQNKEIIIEDPKDFIDAFLSKIDESSTDSSFHGQLGLNNLKGIYHKIDLTTHGIIKLHAL